MYSMCTLQELCEMAPKTDNKIMWDSKEKKKRGKINQYVFMKPSSFRLFEIAVK